MPSVRSAQALLPLAEMALKVPSGASTCPEELLPQQATVPSVRIAHVNCEPAAIAV